jgi:hypothetical protein
MHIHTVSIIILQREWQKHVTLGSELEFARYEVFRAVLITIYVVGDMTPCRVVNSERRYEGVCCHHIPEFISLLKYSLFVGSSTYHTCCML